MTQINLLTFSMRDAAPKEGADWFRIVKAKAKGDPTKVYIYDEIGFWGTTAKDFAATLSEIDTDEIELHLNSPGGSVFDGLAIMAALKDHKAKVTAKVDGMAASAASFILQAADTRLMTRNAQVMIHDAVAYAGGNATQMRKAADLLDRVSDNIADIYAVRSGQGTVESWRATMVSGDEWYNGNEAVEAGLADEVVDNPEEEEDADAPDESTNVWSTEAVEQFLQTPPEKLAASAKHVAITNRVEEAHMTGPNPQKQTPPAAPQPPAPVSTPAAEAPAPAASVMLMVNGAEVSDLAAVQAHITGLEAFQRETIEGGRKEFVAKLAKDGKILASAEGMTATESFALSLSSEQFAAWKASMDVAPSNTLLGQHGVTPGDQSAPGSSTQNAASDRISVLEEIVQSHRDAGLSDEQIAAKASFKELQQLKSNQTGS